MLQNVNTAGHASWPISILGPIVSEPKTPNRSKRSRGEATLPPPSDRDVALLYPEAVVVSSDALLWQNVRVIHLRHSLDEMVVPPSESHCLVLNLSAPLQLNARLGKRTFEGRVQAGEVAFIPTGTTWSF